MNVEELIVNPLMSIIDALQRLDETAHGCLFVADEEKHLIGSLTDGDVRRLILRTGSLVGNVGEAMNDHPVCISEDERANASDIMVERKVPIAPVVTSEGTIVDIVLDNGQKIIRKQLPESIPVVMMAGGVGSRLLPLTSVLPKPLIPVNGISIAERIIGRFHDSGCDDFYLVLNYKKTMIKAYFDDLERDYNVTYIDENEFLGTGGGLRLAKPYLSSTFILTNCDILVNASINELLNVHRKAGNAITCICSLKNFTIPYGTIEISEGGTIEGMQEKPNISSLINTGCYMVEPIVLDYIEEDENIGFPDVMARCQKAGLKAGVFPVSEGAWLDMGQFDEMKRMQSMLKRGDLSALY